MARLLYRIGSGAHRHGLLVVLVWLLLLAGAVAGASTLAGATSTTVSIPGQESTTALQRINEEFGSGGATARVVVRAPEGQHLTEPGHAAAVADLVAELGAVPGVAAVSDPLQPSAPAVDPDLETAYSTVTFTTPAIDIKPAQREAVLAAVANARANGLTAEVTGEAVAEVEESGHLAEVVGVVAALLVLAVTYGSLVVAGMNLLTAGVGVGIGALGITIATGFAELQATTPILATMLGLAVGIDYALFIINRYRQEVRGGAEVGPAIATAVGTAGSAVVTAGLTVVIALVGLAVVGIPFLTQMGVAAAATVVVAVLVAVTLVPAVLGFAGGRVLPRRERRAPGTPARERGFYRGWARGLVRRRVAALLATAVGLAIVAVPLFSLQTALAPSPPEGSTQARAEQLIAENFGEGFNGPLAVLVEGDDAPAAAARAADAIRPLGEVVAVSPGAPNTDGTAALLTVVPKSGPVSEATKQLVADLRAALSDLDGAKASVTGPTAVSLDVAESLDDALPVYLVVVVGLALLLLVLVFRSVLVPLVGVLGFLLTIGAALGATTAVFQWGWLAGAVNLDTIGPVASLTPIMVVGILFGLAMDYQVFLVSQMHEAHHRGVRARDAIVSGFRQAAPVVVAAALIMFSVFAGFVPADDATLKSIAFALAFGILVDAFLVRMVLVPAALALLGARAWWLPRWLRWLPALDVEGGALADRRAPAPVP